jgi:hypothetical protein
MNSSFEDIVISLYQSNEIEDWDVLCSNLFYFFSSYLLNEQ